MAEVYRYDSQEVTVVFDGVVIRGLADGTFVSTEKTSENFESVAGADGTVSTSETNDPRGMITLTVKQTSPELSYLNQQANQGTVAPCFVYAPNREKAGGSQARIRKPSDKEFGKTITNREFSIEVFDYTTK